MLFASGILLGIAALALLLGMHFGPHSHFVSLLSVMASTGFLITLLITSGGDGTIYFLLGLNFAVIGCAEFLLRQAHRQKNSYGHYKKPLLRDGIAVSDLNPVGVVQAGGELWSATSPYGEIKAGSKVDIISSGSVRLEVMAAGENDDPARPVPKSLFRIQDLELPPDKVSDGRNSDPREQGKE